MNQNQTQTSQQTENRIENMINFDAKNFVRLDDTVRSSLYRADMYVESHLHTDSGFTDTAVTTIGLARLNWILEKGLRTLFGRISPKEFHMLSSTIQEEIMSPDDLGKLVNKFAEEMRLGPDSYKSTPFGPFVDKLLGFSELQLLVLHDLLEEYWHVGKYKMTCEEFLRFKGLLKT